MTLAQGKLFDRFDLAVVRRFFSESEVLPALEERGFADFEFELRGDVTVPHLYLFGTKGGCRYQLIDTCLRETVVRAKFFRDVGYDIGEDVALLVVHWVREQDPTASFSPDRPPLPLQEHPGLGVLRRAFRVAVRLAVEMNQDGVANVPKFFHDALIFYRSRLFLFLDGSEQGRFQALARDLASLSLRDASLVVTGGGVRDESHSVYRWAPGYQVFPLTQRLTSYLHSRPYAEGMDRMLDVCRFSWDGAVLEEMHRLMDTGACPSTHRLETETPPAHIR